MEEKTYAICPKLTTVKAIPQCSPRIEEALREKQRVVVVGDPGSGKSTMLKYLALRLAKDADAPLPILLPLNAYARLQPEGNQPASLSLRVLRGGSWDYFHGPVRCALRFGYIPDYFYGFIGFRLVSPGSDIPES